LSRYWNHGSIALIVFVLVSCLSIKAEGKDALRLVTASTVLTFRAGPESPEVLSLATPGGVVWKSRRPQPLIEKVLVGGKWQIIRWKLDSVDHQPNSRRITVVYLSLQPRLRLTWEWQARDGVGPIGHTIRIENPGNETLGLPLQSSLEIDWTIPTRQPLRHMWIEKGAGTPAPEGTHEVTVTDHYHWVGTSSTYAKDRPDKTWEPIPWMLVELAGKENSGWYMGIEFSGRTRLRLLREGSNLKGDAGLNPEPGPYLTKLKPGETFTPPTIFLGAFSGDSEAAGNILRRWVARILQNPDTVANPSYPLLVNNSWGSGMDINEAKARGMMDDAAKLGIEMFHVDAGWFRGVGDWYSNFEKIPHGVSALADYAHRLGVKFGLWVDWTQAGTDINPGALNVHDPKIRGWLTRDVPADWKPEPFKGVTIDIGYAPAKEWCARQLDRMVNEFHLDMLEHDGYLLAEGCERTDHPHVACDPSTLGPEPWLESSCSTDVSYHSTRAYYELYEKLRARHPGLLLEACNDGGRMVDFGTAAHTDYFSITDTYDPLSNRRAFYDASHVLPASMLECYVERYPAKYPANFTYMLRSGMMGWCTIMQDTTAWTPQEHAAARHEFELYKSRLRPLIRAAELYHISPRPDGVHWDGMEYFNPASGQGVVYAFRGSTADEIDHQFVLKGLRPDRQYHLHFEDQTSADRNASGHELVNSGIKISLPLTDSSELVFIQEVVHR
jgi:alpha-galactosidase